MNQKVDDFINNAKKWRNELELLRAILLNCGLTEELKWKQPCYMFNNTNLVIISEFKDSCVISFLNGALLNDEKQILTKAGINTQAARIIRFTNTKQIIELQKTLTTYIFQSIEIEKAGIKFKTIKNNEFVFVDELQQKINTNALFKKAFLALTPGRQRAYNIYFSGAKQSKTRNERIESYTPKILLGIGFNDCTCGLSKKMPQCDGSHKILKNKR